LAATGLTFFKVEAQLECQQVVEPIDFVFAVRGKPVAGSDETKQLIAMASSQLVCHA
jgi:hypothetical protein